jgi:hypothetical protein
MRTRGTTFARQAIRNELHQLREADRLARQLAELLAQLEEWRETIVDWKAQAVAVAQDHEQRIRALEAKVP